MKKKYIIILICSIVAILGIIAFVIIKNGTFSKEITFSEDIFACKDSTQVTKIMIADMNGNAVLIQRGEKGWKLSDGTPVNTKMVEQLMSTMTKLRVESVITGKKAQTMEKVMATSAIKVEVYENLPKFTLFNHPFFVKERLAQTYYIGPETEAHIGNYALFEGLNDKLCIINIPDMRGIVSPRFSPRKQDWISHDFISISPKDIQSIAIQDYLNPEQSYTIRQADRLHYDVYDNHNNKLPIYDTTKIQFMLAEFRDKKWNSMVNQLPPEQKEHIFKDNLFKVVTITDIKGKSTKISCYFMDDEYDYYDENNDKLTDIEHLYNQDVFYAILNNDKKNLYVLQYFGFGRIVQTPLSYIQHPSQRTTTEN